MNPWIKICGITCLGDAELALEAGADAIGVNLVPSSARLVSESVAREIVEGVARRVEVVLVVANQAVEELEALRQRTGARWLQLHGEESPAALRALEPEAMKAVRIGGPEDVRLASQFGGERLLLDGRVDGLLGGSGRSFDWTLVSALARERRIILAGGLTVANVGRALDVAGPWGVDVASGVETPGNPRRKSPERLRRFIRVARSGTRT